MQGSQPVTTGQTPQDSLTRGPHRSQIHRDGEEVAGAVGLLFPCDRSCGLGRRESSGDGGWAHNIMNVLNATKRPLKNSSDGKVHITRVLPRLIFLNT